jgi:hypothetical protein
VRITCKDSAPFDFRFGWWLMGWAVNHVFVDGGFIQEWDLVNQPDLLAQKSISQRKVVTAGPTTGTFIEKTELKLKPLVK